MTLDISDDYAIFDGGETVTLRQLRSDGVTTVTVNNVCGSPVAENPGSYQGVSVTGRERSFTLNATQVGTRGVIVGDILTDSKNSTWRLTRVDLRTLDTRWYCVGSLQE